MGSRVSGMRTATSYHVSRQDRASCGLWDESAMNGLGLMRHQRGMSGNETMSILEKIFFWMPLARVGDLRLTYGADLASSGIVDNAMQRKRA